jgi:hypothetical protein
MAHTGLFYELSISQTCCGLQVGLPAGRVKKVTTHKATPPPGCFDAARLFRHRPAVSTPPGCSDAARLFRRRPAAPTKPSTNLGASTEPCERPWPVDGRPAPRIGPRRHVPLIPPTCSSFFFSRGMKQAVAPDSIAGPRGRGYSRPEATPLGGPLVLRANRFCLPRPKHVVGRTAAYTFVLLDETMAAYLAWCCDSRSKFSKSNTAIGKTWVPRVRSSLDI